MEKQTQNNKRCGLAFPNMIKMSSCVEFRSPRITISRLAGQDAGEEDGGEGLRPEGQHHPGEETGHGGDYQQPTRSNKLLKDASENSHDDGRDI